MAHRLDQGSETEADHADHDGEPDLGAQHIGQAGARAVPDAVGEDQRHRRARHEHDDQAGDQISGV